MHKHKEMQNVNDHSWLRQGSTSPEDVQKSYDDWALNYNETLDKWGYLAPQETARLLLENAPAVFNRVLDVGCGTGLSGMALRNAGFTGWIDGYDLSVISLDEAKKYKIYTDLEQVNLHRLPLPAADRTYDSLICVGVLTYVPDSEAVLREFARLVSPGGVVLVSQRSDLFEERKFGETIVSLEQKGIFANPIITSPQPYLPQNPQFGSEILVHYIILPVS